MFSADAGILGWMSSSRDSTSLVDAKSLPSLVLATDKEVCDDAGDPFCVGVSVVSVTLEDGTDEFVCEASSAGNGCGERSPMGIISGVEGSEGGLVGRRGGECGGVGGGVLRSEACEMISGGGRAFGEMMMLGACEGSWGLRDQMAHFAVGLGEDWGDSFAVDIDPMCEYDEVVGSGMSAGGGGGVSVLGGGGGSWGVMGADEGGGS